MELNHVKEFIALTKTENYLEAAENLFTSQSSLSKHIKSLEAELGTTLFDRTTRQVKLNEAEEQTLTIGSIPIMTPYSITDMLIDFKKANVKINLSIIEGEAG